MLQYPSELTMDATATERAERHGKFVGRCLALVFWTLLSSLPLAFVYFTAKYVWLRRIVAYPIQLSMVGIGIWAGVKTYKFSLRSQEADEESGTYKKRKDLLSELILLIPAVLVAIATIAFLRLLVSHQMASAFDWNWDSGRYWDE
jgi:hypothetical protein